MLAINSSFDFMASLQQFLLSSHPKKMPALISIKLRLAAGNQIGTTSSSNRHLDQPPLDGHQIAFGKVADMSRCFPASSRATCPTIGRSGQRRLRHRRGMRAARTDHWI
jgi:hypothetical protein